MASKRQPFDTRQVMRRDRLEVFHHKDAGGVDVALHCHEFYEVYLFLQGDVTYLVDGQQYKLLPGDVITLPPNVSHRPIFHSSATYERVVIWVTGGYLSELGSGATDLSRCFYDREAEQSYLVPADARESLQIRNLALSLFNSYQDDGAWGQDLMCSGLVTLILLNIHQAFHGGEDASTHGRVENNPVVNAALRYIKDHLTERVALEDVAGGAFASKYHLAHEFKKAMGLSVYQYILNQRLLLARGMIARGLPVVEVYAASGFRSYANFFKAFKDMFGMTPKEYYRLGAAGGEGGEAGPPIKQEL
jgi:AraC-like DNA-binding protein